MKNNLSVVITGHCFIIDDLNNVHLNQTNAIHSPNMSQIIARALAHEPNCVISRIGLGNGGVYYETNAKITTVKYKHVRDGLYPADMDWNSILYNETLSINDFNLYSVEKDRISQVIIEFKLANDTTSTQLIRDINDNIPLNPNEPFIFNEIGLFSNGKPLQATHGYQIIRLNTSDSNNICLPAGNYEYVIAIDDEEPLIFSVKTNKSLTYTELVEILNDDLNKHNTTATLICYRNKETIDSYIKIQSNNVGRYSKINIKKINPANNWLFGLLADYAYLERPINGKSTGLRNHPINHQVESERMLTHMIFSPVLKTSSREFNIRYTLTIHVQKTTETDEQVLVIS